MVVYSLQKSFYVLGGIRKANNMASVNSWFVCRWGKLEHVLEDGAFMGKYGLVNVKLGSLCFQNNILILYPEKSRVHYCLSDSSGIYARWRGHSPTFVGAHCPSYVFRIGVLDMREVQISNLWNSTIICRCRGKYWLTWIAHRYTNPWD